MKVTLQNYFIVQITTIKKKTFQINQIYMCVVKEINEDNSVAYNNYCSKNKNL